LAQQIIKLKLEDSEKDALVDECIRNVNISGKTLCNLYVDLIDCGKQHFERKLTIYK